MAVNVNAKERLTQEIYKAGSKNQNDLQLKLAKNPVQGIAEALQKGLSNSAIKFALEGNLSLKRSAKNPQTIVQIFSSLFQSDKPIIQSLFSDLLKDLKSNKHIGILFSSAAENRSVKPIVANVIKNLVPEKRESLLSFLVGQGVILEIDKIEMNKNIDLNIENKKPIKNSKEAVINQPKKLDEGKPFHPGFSINFAQASAIKETLNEHQNAKVDENPDNMILSKFIDISIRLQNNSDLIPLDQLAKDASKLAQSPILA